jgi:hypothetical protein
VEWDGMMLVRRRIHHDSMIHIVTQLVNIYNNNQKKHEYQFKNDFIFSFKVYFPSFYY